MPKIVDHDDKRRGLVRSALGLFIKRGYASVGMRDLADAAGMSKSAVYHYFPSKELLYQEAARMVVRDDLAALRSALEDLGEDGFESRFDALIRHMEAREEWYAAQLQVLLNLRGIEGGDEPPAGNTGRSADPYIEAISEVLGIERPAAAAVYHQATGVLVGRVFDPRAPGLAESLVWLRSRLARETAGEIREDSARNDGTDAAAEFLRKKYGR